jgi:hypothetical protein
VGNTPGYWKNHLDWFEQTSGQFDSGCEKVKGTVNCLGSGTPFYQGEGGPFLFGVENQFTGLTMYEVIRDFTNTLGAHAVAHVLNAASDPVFAAALSIQDVIDAYNEFQSGMITRAELMNLWLTLEGEPIEIEIESA